MMEMTPLEIDDISLIVTSIVPAEITNFPLIEFVVVFWFHSATLLLSGLSLIPVPPILSNATHLAWCCNAIPTSLRVGS